jgi:poly(A) polymerase
MKEIWSLQWQMAKRHGKRPWRILEHPRFRAAYDFLLLRALVDKSSESLVAWWTAFMDADEDARVVLMQHPEGQDRPKPRRRRKAP